MTRQAFGPAAILMACLATAVIAQAQRRSVGELAADLAAIDPAVRARAACDLKDHGDLAVDAMDALLRMLGDRSPVDPSVCRERLGRGGDRETTPGELAAAALVGIGSRAVAPLIGALQGEQWIARRNAAWALGALDDPRAIAPLTSALRDREAGVREQAAWALGALDAEAAARELAAALQDPDAAVRRQAAWALGASGSAAGVDALVQALQDLDKDVRTQAAWALGAIGEPRASTGLLGALKDAEPEVRRQAAWALGVLAR